MSNKSGNTDFGVWLQGLGGGVIFVIGLVTTLVNFVKLRQGNAGLVTVVLLGVGVLLVLLACLYFVRFWQPEQEDESPKLLLPAPRGKQEKQQRKQEKKRKVIRRLAAVGLVLVPLLVAGGGLGWRYVQSLPSDQVVILVADFDGPDTQNNRITEEILKGLRQRTQNYEDVTVEALEETVTEQAGSEAARAIAKQLKATIMIWGWYGAPGDGVPVSINFEVLNPSEYLPDFGDVASGETRIFALSELSSFELQLRLSSEMSYLTLFTLGIAEYAAEDWAAAIALFDASLKGLEASESLNLSTFFYKGNAHAEIGSFEEAIAAYDAALKLKPDYPNAIYNKGSTLAALN
ncbi:MAG: tetratricopeptide repeat protein [Phormidesmis sp.]